MEEPHVSEKFITWVLGMAGAVVAFFTGLSIRWSMRIRKLETAIAVNNRGDQARDMTIARIEANIAQIEKSVKNMELVVMDQKEIYISTENERKRATKIMEQQARIIFELTGEN